MGALVGPAVIDLRCGRWQDVLSDVECDALICDPPFSDRVHEGQRAGSDSRKSTLTYAPLSRDDAHEFAASWAPRTRWWAVIFSDHLAQRWWQDAWQDVGWYVFAPVNAIRLCPTPRMAGDGPTSACDYITVARPKHRLPPERSGSRPGYYLVPGINSNAYAAEQYHPGGKPSSLMRAIVRDYSRPGDLVCDPCCGGGTTLVAARVEGRRAVGAEMDPATYAIASRRIANGWTPSLFDPV